MGLQGYLFCFLDSMIFGKKPQNTAKQAFFYLTSFFALGFVAVAVGNICFQLINHFFPDPETSYSAWVFSQSAIKFSIASLVVAAPIFFFTTRVINHSLSKKDLDADSGVRRWLTYIVMFIAVATVIVDLINILYSFLDGELTLRFFLKALTILIIAGVVLWYYISDMHSTSDAERAKKHRLWVFAFLLLVLLPFFASFLVLESPKTARDKKIDADLEQAVMSTASAVVSSYAGEGALPETLTNLRAVHMTPEKIDELRYEVLSERDFSLCTAFQRDNRDEVDAAQKNSLLHPAGEYCFTYTAVSVGGMYDAVLKKAD